LKCKHVKPDGTQCQAPAANGGTLCNAHNGVLAAHASAGGKARAAKRKAARQAVERDEILATMGLDARLRVEAAKREGELISALLDLALVDRDRQALLAVFDRLEGRASQRVIQETSGGVSQVAEMSTDDLFKLLGDRVVPASISSPSPVKGDK